MNFSVSSIKTFEQCPHRYKCRYILGIPALEKSEALIKGSDIHDVFNQSTIRAKEGKSIKESILKHYNYEKYKQSFDNFLKMCERIQKSGASPIPFCAEKKITDTELCFTGVIDRIDKVSNHILISDYKTGKLAPIEHHYFQLGAYVHLYNYYFKHMPTHWGIYYTEHDIFIKERIKPEIVTSTIAKIKEMIEKINRAILEDDFPPNKSRLCDWCEYNYCCDYYG